MRNPYANIIRKMIILMILTYMIFLVWMLTGEFGFPLNMGVRQKFYHVSADLQTIGTGLETYFIDAECYPARLMSLTSPIAYLSEIPRDQFAKKTKYSYWTGKIGQKGHEKDIWVVWGLGPDKKMNLNASLIQSRLEQSPHVPPYEALINEMYDVSNGAASAGDIYRVSEYYPNINPRPKTPLQ